DLKPGLEMARNSNVDFAAAGWSHSIPEIKEQMKRESKYYLETVEQFNRLILCE
ncbi:hydrolase, partial [Virgibacillus halodenitrificans]|nr:hydrolase [Virgibacillus halodenitrificans]